LATKLNLTHRIIATIKEVISNSLWVRTISV